MIIKHNNKYWIKKYLAVLFLMVMFSIGIYAAYVLELEFNCGGNACEDYGGGSIGRNKKYSAYRFDTVGAFTLTKVMADMRMEGTINLPVTVCIYASSGGAPTGGCLGGDTFVFSSSELTNDYAYKDFTFSGISLDATTQYFLVYYINSVDGSNFVRMNGYHDSGTNAVYSSDDGSSWANEGIPTYAGNFSIYSGLDYTEPTVSWNALTPANNTIYNTDVPFFFNPTNGSADMSNCTLFNNNSTEITIDSIIESSDNNFIQYNVTTSEVGVYDFYVTCTDINNHAASTSIKTILVDMLNPAITWNTPADDNSSVINYADPMNIQVSDENLFRINVTVENITGNIIYENYTDNWTASQFNFMETIPFTQGGTYFITVDATDSHTKKIKGNLSIITTNKAIIVDGIKISLNNAKNTSAIIYDDRIGFVFETNGNGHKDTHQIKLNVPNYMTYTFINDSYKGHYAITYKNNPLQGYWVDFMPAVPEIDVINIIDNTIVVEANTTTLVFASIGLLNNVTETRQLLVLQQFNTSAVITNGTYYLTTDPILTGLTEVNYTIGNVTTNATSNAYNLWNTTAAALTDGITSWLVEAYQNDIFMGNASGSFEVNVSNFTIVAQYDACTAGDVGLLFRTYDDNTLEQVNFTLKTQFSVYKAYGGTSAETQTVDVSTGDTDQYYLCISGDTDYYNINAMLEYYGGSNASTYSIRDYYLKNAITQPGINNYDLYMLPADISTQILFTVTDQNEQPLINHIIQVQKYYVENNTYQLIAMGKTNDIGQDNINLQLYDSWYRFLVYDTTNNLVYIGTSTRLVEATQTITVAPATISSLFKHFGSIETLLTYNNNTNIFTFTWADPTGSPGQVCLKVVYNTINNNTQLCGSCSTSASGTLLCNAGNAPGTYTSTAYAVINGVQYVIDSLSIEIAGDNIQERLGNDGLIISVLLIGTLSFAFIWTPVGAIVAAIIGVIAMVIIGILPLSWAAVVSLVIIGGIIIYKMRG